MTFRPGKSSFFLALILLLLAAVTPAQAEKKERYLFVGTTFPLIFEQKDDGTHHGLATDILDRISLDTGIRFETQLFPWARALALARAGVADGLIGPYWSQERAEFLDYSTRHFYSDRMVFVARRSSDPHWTGTWDSLTGMRILTVKGWAYGPAFDAARPMMNPIVTSDFDQALRMLMANRVDLLAANERTALIGFNQRKLNGDLEILNPAFHATHGYFGFPKVLQDRAFQDRFNAALERLWESGELAAMSAEYGLTP